MKEIEVEERIEEYKEDYETRGVPLTSPGTHQHSLGFNPSNN
jgi:hypothetical protein